MHSPVLHAYYNLDIFQIMVKYSIVNLDLKQVCSALSSHNRKSIITFSPISSPFYRNQIKLCFLRVSIVSLRYHGREHIFYCRFTSGLV